MSEAGSFLLRLQEQCGGSIPFERFMHEALYHSQFGYYAARIRNIGRRGDFSTWPTMDRTLALAIAAWLSSRRSRHIIEIGAGNGNMANDVLDALGWWTRGRTTYHIVETSPVLRCQQQKTLRHSQVCWHEDMPSALRAANGQADIFSNELADAFPCSVFVRHEGIWRELALHIEGGHAREILRASRLPDSTVFDADFSEGSRVEALESYHAWLQSWAPFWKNGHQLTVDYGNTMPALYFRRPSGTLRAYSHQQCFVGSDVYAAFGHRDITADVNFTDLQRWGETIGWQTEYLSTLEAFIGREIPKRPISGCFLEAAAAFRVLIQRMS